MAEGEENEPEPVDIGEILNDSTINITGFGFEFVESQEVTEMQREYPYDEITYMTVAIKILPGENPSEIVIGNTKLENVLPPKQISGFATPKTHFLIRSETNEIIAADFTVGKGGGKYNLGGIDFDADEGASIEYDLKKGILDLSNIESTKINTPIDEIPKEIKKIIGHNLDFPEGFTLSGRMIPSESSYILESGNFYYRNFNFEVGYGNSYYRENSNIVFFGGNEFTEEDFNPRMNYVIPKKDSIQFISNSEEGSSFSPVPIKFQDNELLGMTSEELYYAKFGIHLKSGDSLEIIPQENKPSKFIFENLKRSEYNFYGDSQIINDGHSIKFNRQNEIEVERTHLEYYDILRSTYMPIEMEIEIKDDEGNLNKNKFIMDSEGEFSLLDKEDNNRVVYTRPGLSDILKNGRNESIGAYQLVFERQFEKLGGFSDPSLLNKKHDAIKNLMIAGITPEELDLFMSSVADKKESKQFMFSELDMLQDISKEASYIGMKKEEMLDLSEQIISSDGGWRLTNEPDLLSLAIKEFDGKNMEEIIFGARILEEYTGHYTSQFASLAKRSGMKISEIQDEESLAKSFSKGLNSITKTTGGNEHRYIFQGAAVLINQMHDQEGYLYHSDEIRKNIAKDLNFESKYYLINYANSDLYQSTFDKLYENFPEDSVQRIKEEIDPEGEHWADFVMGMARRDKVNDLINQDSNFFIEGIEKALGEKGTSELAQNVVFLTNTFEEYYTNSEHNKEREYLEDLLLKKYSEAKGTESMALYGYLIKLNEETCKSGIKKAYSDLCAKLPDIPTLEIPKSWAKDKTIAAKLYFYDDEAWFGITGDQYTKAPYNYILNKGESTKDTTVLEKNINGIKFKVVLTLDNSDVSEAVNGEEFDIISHRGHSYHLPDTFNGQSDSTKLFYLGSCGSYGETPYLQKNYPNAFLISDENTGQGDTNNRAINMIMENLARGTLEWGDLKENIPEDKGIIFPHEKNQLVLRYAEQFKDGTSYYLEDY